MDGFAVRAEAGRTSFAVAAYIPAGSAASEPLQPGTAARILTGAPLPPGADTVIPFEDADEDEGKVFPRGPVRAGANVRRRGEDLRAGERVLERGRVLGPAEVSFLATSSRPCVPVFCRPRVAVLSTGDELVAAGEALAPGKIHDSNGPAVAAAVRQLGGEPIVLGIARDDAASLRRLLGDGLRAADALVTTAGVSRGDRDLVREILAELGVRQLFWNVDMKPGRPMAFGVRDRTLVFSLPGNPVSTILSFDQFVRPALLRMMGHRAVLRPLVPAVLQEPLRRKPGRVGLVRVRLERSGGTLRAWSAGNQDTGILSTMLRAEGIAIIPADWGDVAPGTTIDVQVGRDGLEP
jgi:molybdopterin molybdotransferase